MSGTTFSPATASGGAPPPLKLLSQQSPDGIHPSTPSVSPSPQPAFVIVATDGAGANLRAGPSTSAPVITTLAEGTPVEALEGSVSAEGRAWRQIRSGDRDGWIVSVVVRQR